MAACTNTTPNDVECSGSNTSTTVNNSGTGTRTVTVTQGSSVSSGQTTVIAQGTSGQITNDGVIETDSSAGSTFYSAAWAIGNTGEARITNNANGSLLADGVNAIGARFTATNSAAVLVNSGIIGATGTATSNAFGPVGVAISAFSSDVRVTNSGSIASAAVGIGIDHSGTGETYISNTSTGSISGTQTGLYVRNARGPVQIDNAGSIIRSGSGTSGFFNAAIYIVDQSPSVPGTQVIINNSGIIDGGGSYGILAIQQANGTLEINNNGTISGGITRSSSGLGSLIDNSGTINGDVVLSFGEDTFIVRGANAAINGRLDGGFDTDTLRFVDVGNLQFTPTQQTFRFENIFLDSGSLRLNSATFETFGNEGVGAFTTQAGSTLTLTGGQSSFLFADGGTTTINGTLVVDRSAQLSLTAGAGLSHDFIATSGSTTRFILDTASGSTVFSGQIRATNIAFQPGSVIDLDVRDLNLLANGRTFDVAVATDSLTDASGAITDNSVLFDFSKQVIGGNTLRITMEQLLSIADTINPADPNSSALAGALQGLIDSGSASGNAVSTVLGGFGTVETLAAAVADFSPDSSNMVALGALAMIDPVFATVRQRASTGAMANGNVHLWLSAGLFSRSLDPQGMASGFDGEGQHFTIGAEAGLDGRNSITAGLAFDRATSDFDNGSGALSTADLSSNRLYGYVFLPTGSLRLNAVLGLGWGDVDTSRAIPVLGDATLGTSDVDSSFGRIELGYDLGKGAFVVTPIAGLQFANVRIAGIEESGSVGALSIAKQTISSTRADVGLGFEWRDTAGKPSSWSLAGAVRYASQLNDLDTPLRVQFTGGGNAFDWSVSDLPGDSVELDLGARFNLGKLGVLALEYRGSFADEADAHSGMATVSIGF